MPDEKPPETPPTGSGDDAIPTSDFLDVPTLSLSVGGLPGGRIGPYKLLEKIGEGGMGVVYLADQERPLRRRVALKLVKLGMDTKQVLARFESERQALAIMNHPNIAKVHDAGSTDQGRPYFVMEYVKGIPITDYCDRRRLTNRERLELFIPVCQAIHHAHQKGIIHRDVKPSNVLVAVEDGKPVPKVIDFGVAKATSQRLTERTLYTQQGVLIGTPEYMSPEQAGTTALDVDTRTDIYSLGVLLYELLVGSLPFDPKTLRDAGLLEMMRIIREEDPPKPTTRFSSLGDTASEVAKRRHTDVRSLARHLRGELEWITMRAMDKDPARRYASASELSADIGRHLRDEPVLASPPGLAYRLGKLARRHVGFVAAGSLVLVILIAGLITSTALYLRAERARANAEMEAERNRLEAVAFEELMRLWMDLSQPVSEDFLETVEKILAIQRQLEPGNSRALFVTLSKYRGLAGMAEPLFESDRTKQTFDRWFNEIVGLVEDALSRGDPEAPGMVDLLYNLDELDNRIREDMSRRSLVLRQEQLPPGAPEIRENIVNLAKLLIDSATHWLALGRHDDGKRSYTEAFSLLQEADAKKELTESRWEVVDSLVGLKQYREADTQLKTLMEEGTTVRGLTRCVFVDRARMRVLGDYELDVAVDMLRDHMEHDHPLATGLDTYWWLGQAHEKLQQFDAARDAYLLALEIRPDSLPVQSALRLLRVSP